MSVTRKLQLHITQDHDSWRSVSMPQIHLQYLRILVLDSEFEITFSTFIEVTLPVLEKSHVIHGWSATASRFKSLAHRSNYFPHLRDFDLKVPSTAVTDAGALLALMPCVTNIYLPAPSTIFDHLALNGLASGLLAPRLQTLIGGSISNWNHSWIWWNYGWKMRKCLAMGFQHRLQKSYFVHIRQPAPRYAAGGDTDS
ncbi:hypothetical protein JOM56_010405 [Amanita muscaria]